ncbi:PREDICTED: uncharacterized protein LOC105143120 [Acromyrmex echinatior]|uniref:uncharacterized protein LOC105143120 n=1 Tax=Acromyrmex echinatior TaxID=103372 RepID=UPI000580D7A8|nr:PREDICTED: uncharacterized protein LOC105143120 [Acromyrmex echinatior]
MGQRAAVAAVVAEVDTLEVEANPRPVTELPVPVAAAVLEEVDTLVVVVEYLQLTVHPREVAVDTPVVAAEDTLAVVADIPVVAAEDTLVVVAADIPAVAVSEALVVIPEAVVAVIPAVVVEVTPAVAVAVADRRRLMVLQVEVADRVTPAMEDTNTNPDMCSPGETISVLNRVGFHQIFRIEQCKSNLLQSQDSSVRSINLIDYVLSKKRRRSERIVLIKR